MDEEAAAEYTEFRDLEENADQSPDWIAEQLASEDWKATFEALDALRRLNKFRKSVMEGEIARFGEFILNQVDNLRSSISRNACWLVNEIFQTSKNLEVEFSDEFGQFVVAAIPVMIHKCGYEKKFIQAEAQKALETIVAHVKSKELVQGLLEGTSSKNKLIHDVSCDQLPKAVEQFVSPEVEASEYAFLIEYLDEAVKDPISKVKNNARKSVRVLKKALGGEEEVLNVFRKVLGDDTRTDHIEEAFVLKKKAAKKTGGFREFLKT